MVATTLRLKVTVSKIISERFYHGTFLLLFMLGKKPRVHCTPCKCAATELYHQAEVIYL